MIARPRVANNPTVAVRRFMLYATLLHELGHLHVVDPTAGSTRRRYGHERAAEEFALAWRRRLWAEPFEHRDPVHNPPGKLEIAAPPYVPAGALV